MKQPIMIIKVDKKQLLANEYSNVRIRAAIDEPMPVLEFTLDDKYGRNDSTLAIKLGSFVQVEIFEDNDEKNKWFSTTFVVERLYNGHEYVKGNAGKIQVYCVQAWEVFGDYTSHAYGPQPMSDLIKSLCKSANALACLKVDDKNFATSNETRKIPRYKCNESELDFIKNKLMPYTVINNSNSYFFIDSQGNTKLGSYSSFFSSTEKAIIGPDAMLASKNDTDFFKTGLSKKLPRQMFSSLSTDIGGLECIRQLKEKACMEIPSAADSKYIDMTGNLGLSIKAGGASVSNQIPFDALKFTSVDSTSAHAYYNRVDSDVIGLCVNNSVALTDLLYAQVGIKGFAETVDAGDTIYLSAPAYNNQESKNNKITWISGKWLVQATNIIYNGSNPSDVIHVLDLIRPTLSYDKATTSIKDADSLAVVDA